MSHDLAWNLRAPLPEIAPGSGATFSIKTVKGGEQVIRRPVIGAGAAAALLSGSLLIEARPAQAQTGADVRVGYAPSNPAMLGVPTGAQIMDVRVSPAGATAAPAEVSTLPAAFRMATTPR